MWEDIVGDIDIDTFVGVAFGGEWPSCRFGPIINSAVIILPRRGDIAGVIDIGSFARDILPTIMHIKVKVTATGGQKPWPTRAQTGKIIITNTGKSITRASKPSRVFIIV